MNNILLEKYRIQQNVFTTTTEGTLYIFVLPFLHEILNGTEFGLNGIFMGNNTASASFLSIVGI